MKRKFSQITLAVMLTGGAILASSTANTASASTATKAVKHAKHSKKFLGFSSRVECDGDGGAGIVYRFLGMRIGSGDTVPGSALCQ